MVPCPSCGTQNRRGSKYCYHCGQHLDTVFDAKCPSCERFNPTGSAFCAFCGSRIPLPSAAGDASVPQSAYVATSPEKGVPESAEGAAARRELPSWLYEQETPSAVHSGFEGPTELFPSDKESKYLKDIPGTLPRSRVWLPAVPGGSTSRPPTNQLSQGQPRQRVGCLPLLMTALLVATWIALSVRG